MPALEIEEFAQLLITHVRDAAIAACDMSRDPECNSVEARRWRQKIGTGRFDEFAAEIIPYCVDATLFCLHAIDEGVLRLSFTTKSGKTVDLADAGESEMAGWYAGIDAWIPKYSTERFNDDLSDLT